MRFKLFLCFIIVFSLRTFTQNEIVNISGFVTNKEFRLGNASISFFNSSNLVKTVKSDINGNFNTTLPKNKYRVTVEKEGYNSLVGDNFFVDYIFEEPKQLILNMADNKIKVYGRIINKFGEPIKNVDVRIKIGETLMDLTSDSLGNFNFEGQIGLVSIFAEKEGFYGNGTSMLIQNEKLINDVSIVLEAKTFYISGALVKENNYLKDTYLELVNASNNKVISTIKTSKDGLFEFRNILTYEKAYFRIPSLKYKSEPFTINKDLRQFNIFTD